MMITGRQIRMARAALKWKVDDLSEKTEISWARLQKIEKRNGDTNLPEEAMTTLKSAFEDAGIVFIEGTDDCEPGVTIKEKN